MLYVPSFLLKTVLRNLKARVDVSNPQVARRMFERITARWNKPISGYSYVEDNADGVDGEWIFPPAADHKKVLLYFHGGGYFAGSTHTHRALVSQIARYAGISAFSINYRLAPEHHYPAAIHDCVKAYEWLLAKGFAAADICLGGDSAGGGCVVNTLTHLRDNQIPLPKCAFALSPWLDLSLSGETILTNAKSDPILVAEYLPMVRDFYMGDENPRSTYASPIFHSLKGLPPMMVQSGELEMLLSDSKRFADKAKEDGSEVIWEVFPGMFHVFNAFWMVLPKAREANRKVGEFIRVKLSK